MANIAGSYDENAEVGQFDSVPAGTYRAVIAASEIIDISKNADKGRCLNLTWKVETGPQDGRLFWQRINMWPSDGMNNAAKVQEIANAQFAAVRQATGKMAPQDTDELHGIPCMVTFGPQKNNPDYNEVKSVKPVGPVGVSGGGAARSTPSPAQTRQAAPQQQNAPWRQPAA